MKKTFICFITLIFLSVSLSGCVYLRFLKVKNQLDDFERNFTLDDSGGLHLGFENPVLRDSDIVWLMSSEPEKTQQYWEKGQNKEKWTYVLMKRYRTADNEKGNFDIPVYFIMTDGKLTSISLPERFTEYFSIAMFRDLMDSFGDADVSRLRKESRSRVEGSDQYRLPTTREIRSVLGVPYYNQRDKKDNFYYYRYYINTTGPEDRPGVMIKYSFDPENDELKYIESNIKGAKILIDFEQGN